MEQAGEYIYRVPSDSSAKKAYLVDITPGQIHTCTCVAYSIDRNKKGGGGAQGHCKHLQRVYDEVGDEKIVTAKKQEKADKDEFERVRVIEALKATAKELQ